MVPGCLALAALTALAACSGAARTGPGEPGASTTSLPATTASGGATGGGQPAGGPVPAGFRAQDLTFVSPDDGWLLGTAPCSSAPCTSIVRTSDGGHTWVGIPAPRAELEPSGQSGCDAGRLCVRGLRFANSSTGYAYGSSALYLTRDGGATWVRQPGQADAVEVGGGTAIRVGHDMPGCPPGCGYQVSVAPVGGTGWQPVTTPGTLTGNAVQLLRTGHRAFLEIYRNPAGGAGNAQATLATSGDDGQHWTTHPDPCGTQGGQEADSQQMAVADDGSLTVLCRVRAAGSGFVTVSTDGGATFGPHHPTPGQDADAIGAADAKTPLLASGGGALYRSTDTGASWSPVATAPPATRDSGGSGVIGFQNGRTGRWVPGSATVLSTTDGGHTWTAHPFTP